ncbi:MAG: protein-L-isoaspartate O-methyltransferase [Betaproteobacteria bacterium]|nr:protein-L-isoaspartate O-methyltransferase [Betaproteobacteria bacterium]
MNLEQARYNMVEQQIRTWEVLDQEVLDLLFELRREEFVPAEHRDLAFVDMEIPLGNGEVMLSPKLEARMLQELGVGKSDKVLEVGTGSGYMTALLAAKAQHVVSVEIDPELKVFAARNLKAHGIANVTLELGDAARGWSGQAPYDVIVLTGSVPLLSETFLQMLKPSGRLLAVVGEAPVMKARLITCISEGAFNAVDLFETCVPALRNAPRPERFVF